MNIVNSELCEYLSKSAKTTTLAMKLTLISVRYGLLITDLCSYPSDIEIKQTIDEKDPSLYRTFSIYSDFNPRTNPHILQENGSLYRKRLLKFQKSGNTFKEIGRLEAASVKKALVNIVPGSFYPNSILKRRVGLWLWDKCDSPLNENKMKITKAIELLAEHKLFKGSKKESLWRDFFRVYGVTKRSIESGNILPIEDSRKK